MNPIGGISKTDLKKFIAYAQEMFDLPILKKYVAYFPHIRLNAPLTSACPLPSFLDATPTAELEPITENYVQSDEVRVV